MTNSFQQVFHVYWGLLSWIKSEQNLHIFTNIYSWDWRLMMSENIQKDVWRSDLFKVQNVVPTWNGTNRKGKEEAVPVQANTPKKIDFLT